LNNPKFILSFGATWCKNCKTFAPQLANVGREFSLPVAKIDVDELQDLAEEYGVSALPHTIFISNDSTELSYVGSDILILSENLRLFLAGLSSAINSQPTGGIDIPIPVIQEVQDFHRLPLIRSDNSSKSALVEDLLTKINLETSIAASPESEELVQKAFSDLDLPLSPVDRCTGEEATHHLFIFKVPRLNPEGTCSNLNDISDRPFNLAVDAYGVPAETLPAFLRDTNHQLVVRSTRLNRAVNLLYSLTTAHWIGIYRVIDADNELGLLKEAYLGEPSRAVFPLTETFALKSTNSWVGLHGEIRHLPNTRARDEGVSYYECSGSVQSELCLPIFKSFLSSTGNEWRVVGIIDLESWNVNHFTPQMIRDVLEVGFQLGECEEFFQLPKSP
jgi:L-methionine (R)-S-oxide reductase